MYVHMIIFDRKWTRIPAFRNSVHFLVMEPTIMRSSAIRTHYTAL